MSAFLTRLRIEMLPPSEVASKELYVLLQDFVYDSNILGRIVVPAGFKTDFASIPRFAYSYIDPEDKAIGYASVVHDYLYSQAGNGVTRELADRVLREAMEISGARVDQRAVVFNVVRLFGGSHWIPGQPSSQ